MLRINKLHEMVNEPRKKMVFLLKDVLVFCGCYVNVYMDFSYDLDT